ncbi:MAG: type II toxin-antitoxin system RelB/DinJ family antitoxin [Clostridia bacterium]|nr:type II toxin-antitoxin system RelB/DinJ family antitoxin [Clostridia bacterium]
MGESIVEIPVDADEAKLARYVCEAMGMTVEVYMRMCIARLIQKRGMPFDVSPQETEAARKPL